MHIASVIVGKQSASFPKKLEFRNPRQNNTIKMLNKNLNEIEPSGKKTGLADQWS